MKNSGQLKYTANNFGLPGGKTQGNTHLVSSWGILKYSFHVGKPMGNTLETIKRFPVGDLLVSAITFTAIISTIELSHLSRLLIMQYSRERPAFIHIS